MRQFRRITIMLMAGATACLLGSQAYAWQQSPTHSIRHGQTHSTRHHQTYHIRRAPTYGGYYRQPRTYGGYYTQPPSTYSMGYPRYPGIYDLAPGYSPPVTNCGMAGATCVR